MIFCRQQTYVIFYSRFGTIIAEGNWYIEYFDGTYKDYYKNGQIKYEGSYEGETKTGNWKYYCKKGELISNPSKSF